MEHTHILILLGLPSAPHTTDDEKSDHSESEQKEVSQHSRFTAGSWEAGEEGLGLHVRENHGGQKSLSPVSPAHAAVMLCVKPWPFPAVGRGG